MNAITLNSSKRDITSSEQVDKAGINIIRIIAIIIGLPIMIAGIVLLINPASMSTYLGLADSELVMSLSSLRGDLGRYFVSAGCLWYYAPHLNNKP